jgi:hypothetical protein
MAVFAGHKLNIVEKVRAGWKIAEKQGNAD